MKFLKFCPRCLRRFEPCEREDFTQAAIEVGIVCFSSFLPLLAGVGFFAMTKLPNAAERYGNSFMASGEMLLIVSAMIGPLIYFISRKYGKLAEPLTLRFPYSTGFSLTIVIFWFIAGGVVVSNKGAEIYGTELFDESAMWNLSAAVTVLAILILYFATVFRNCMDRIDPSHLMHDDQEDFVENFKNA